MIYRNSKEQLISIDRKSIDSVPQPVDVDLFGALVHLSGNRRPEENAEDSILCLFRGEEAFLETSMPIRVRKFLENVTRNPKNIITCWFRTVVTGENEGME